MGSYGETGGCGEEGLVFGMRKTCILPLDLWFCQCVTLNKSYNVLVSKMGMVALVWESYMKIKLDDIYFV